MKMMASQHPIVVVVVEEAVEVSVETGVATEETIVEATVVVTGEASEAKTGVVAGLEVIVEV
jgi:hypothetical protein